MFLFLIFWLMSIWTNTCTRQAISRCQKC